MNILKLALFCSLRLAFFGSLKVALFAYTLSLPNTAPSAAMPKGDGEVVDSSRRSRLPGALRA